MNSRRHPPVRNLKPPRFDEQGRVSTVHGSLVVGVGRAGRVLVVNDAMSKTVLALDDVLAVIDQANLRVAARPLKGGSTE